jgi:ABC-type branched-subunit amino acid transport system ATPase component
MARTDLPAMSRTTQRALELTGCVGVADMAVELMLVRERQRQLELEAELARQAAILVRDELFESLRVGYLFGCRDEPLDEAGKRIVRRIEVRIR